MSFLFELPYTAAVIWKSYMFYLKNTPQYAHVTFTVIQDESSESAYLEPTCSEVLFYLVGTW